MVPATLNDRASGTLADPRKTGISEIVFSQHLAGDEINPFLQEC